VHGLAHAESYAIDLAWDLVARFGFESRPDPHSEGLAEPSVAPPRKPASEGGLGEDADDVLPSHDHDRSGAVLESESKSAAAVEGDAGADEAGEERAGMHCIAVRQAMPTEFLDDWI